MRGVFGPQHPKMINLQAELKDVRSKIIEEIKHISQGISNEVTVARAKEQTLKSKITQLETALANNNRADLRYQELQREVDSSRKLYADFVGRLKEVDVQQGINAASAHVIQEATAPLRPAPPSKSVRFGIAMLIGLIVSLIAAFVRERLGRNMCSAADVEQATGYRPIAFVPSVRTGKSGPIDRVLTEPHGEFADALQCVRARLQQAFGRFSPFMAVVTSSVPEEGKSVFCVSLARLLSRGGYRVLLIDADLRRPRIGKLLGQAAHGSMADVFGGSKGFADIVQRDQSSGADYVTAYGPTGDAQSVFAPKVMRSLRMLRDYDIILFDTPPIGALPDAAAIAQNCDAALYMVRWGKTPRDVTLDGLRQLEEFGANILGVVFTRVDLRALPKYETGSAGHYHQNYRRYYSNAVSRRTVL